ncbi:MAG: hypothetical protein ABEJ77_04625 [Halanaeroarchaeum sp.]
MDVPTLVSDALEDEDVAAHVPLKGEDALFVTPTRTIRYSAEGILSEESIATFPHDAERVSATASRRKATISLDYGTDGTEEFVVPPGNLDAALHPVLAGVLNANGVTDPGETVTHTFRFSELTVVVTSDRLIKHVGSPVWDREYEEIPFETVRDVEIEEGSVSSQIALATDERTQRIKAPSESFREVRETVEDALLSYHGVDSLAAFQARTETEATTQATESAATEDVAFGSDVEALGEDDGGRRGDAETQRNETAADPLEENGFTSATETIEPAIDPAELRAELDELEAAIDRQRELLDEQQSRIEDVRSLIPDR